MASATQLAYCLIHTPPSSSRQLIMSTMISSTLVGEGPEAMPQAFNPTQGLRVITYGTAHGLSLSSQFRVRPSYGAVLREPMQEKHGRRQPGAYFAIQKLCALRPSSMRPNHL